MSSSSSSASSSRSSPEPPPSPPLKRKRKETKEDPESDSDQEGSDQEPEDDVPALSHAERRRQKKKEKLQAREEQKDSATKKRKLKDGTAAPVSGKRQNSVWVGNMSFKTTQDDLRTFFEGVGEITRINMPTKAPAGPGMKPENRGFAYVDFATSEAKAAAIARSERPLIGRKLLIKDGDDFAGRPAAPVADGVAGNPEAAKTHSKTAQKILRAQKQPPAPTLFLGNLGFETTEQSIKELLEAHRIVKKKTKKDDTHEGEDKEKDTKDGEDKEKKDKPKDVWIRKVRMGTFEDSGLCKGFAFVDFMTIDDATSALINPKNHQLNGRKLVVEYAGADAVRRGAPKVKREEGDAPRRTAGPRGHRPERTERRPYQKPWSESISHHEASDKPAHTQDEEQSSNPHPVDGDDKRKRGTDGTRRKEPRTRPKPGAALALAKRESAAIIPSQGQKITF